MSDTNKQTKGKEEEEDYEYIPEEDEFFDEEDEDTGAGCAIFDKVCGICPISGVFSGIKKDIKDTVKGLMSCR